MALYDKEAEQIVLGSLLQNNELFQDVSEIITEHDFYIENHRIIFQLLLLQLETGSVVDLPLLVSTLKENNQLEKIGGRHYLIEIASNGTSLGALTHTKKIKDLSLRRQFMEHFKNLEQSLIDPNFKIEDILSKSESFLSTLADKQTKYNVKHVKELKKDFLEYLENLKASKGGITGIATNFLPLDEITTGFKGGQLIVLAARPGVGKTTLALNIAYNISLASKLPVLFFSLEMTNQELLLRIICSGSFLEASKIQRGNFDTKEMNKIYETFQTLTSSFLYFDDSPTLTAWEFKQRSRRFNLSMKNLNLKPGLIIVDYLQLMTMEGKRYENRQTEVAAISRNLKAIAKELNVPVLALSQMNRSVEQRGKDHKPQLSDLRESGAIEQDADMVLFLHREEIYNPNIPESEKGMTDLIIAKHRAGPTGNIRLFFHKEHNLFTPSDSMESTE